MKDFDMKRLRRDFTTVSIPTRQTIERSQHYQKPVDAGINSHKLTINNFMVSYFIKNLIKRFESCYTVEPNTGCWLWTKNLYRGGYGQFKVNRGPSIASRVAYEIYRGEIPDGLMVCHSYDVRSCVNPDHLFLGTAKDNTHDMIKKGRKHPNVYTNVKLSVDQVLEIRARKNENLANLAREFKVSPQSIQNIIYMKTWSHI